MNSIKSVSVKSSSFDAMWKESNSTLQGVLDRCSFTEPNNFLLGLSGDLLVW